MERIPGSQPPNLDHVDEMGLAVLAHIIEAWEEALHVADFSTRYEHLLGKLTAQADALAETDEPFLDELEEDIDQIEQFAGTSDDFEKLCSVRVAYWSEVRRAFLKHL